MNMARRLFGLTSAEVLAGVTRHAARRSASAERGSIEPGWAADFAVWSVDTPDELGYWAGHNPCSMVVKDGGSSSSGTSDDTKARSRCVDRAAGRDRR